MVSLFSYLSFYKYRKVIGYHLGMNIAMTSSGVMGIGTGIILGYLYPDYYAIVTIVTTMVAMITGMVFGALVDYQTLLTGVSSGIMSGIMSPMLGAHTSQPLILIVFATALVFFSYALLCFSIRS